MTRLLSSAGASSYEHRGHSITVSIAACEPMPKNVGNSHADEIAVLGASQTLLPSAGKIHEDYFACTPREFPLPGARAALTSTDLPIRLLVSGT